LGKRSFEKFINVPIVPIIPRPPPIEQDKNASMISFANGYRSGKVGRLDNFSRKGTDMTTFRDYQEGAMTTAVYPGKGEGNWTYPALGLAGETGEICEKLKKAIRDDGGQVNEERHAAIKKELGDVLWYVAALCTELRIDMQEVAEQNLAKLAKRKQEGKIHGDGDNR
jgi:NTP pyrophosphatase (non-canonical NTP hydrolase)